MQTDEDFNIKFVGIIKRYKCLYDRKVPEYRNKDEQEKAWVEIALETRESVSHCKERWRNLRACLSRYIKQQNSPDAQHKPYYLTEHMQFLLPFLRAHRQAMGMNNFNYDLRNVKMDFKTGSDQEETLDATFPETQNFNIVPQRMLTESDAASVNCVPDVHVDIDQEDSPRQPDAGCYISSTEPSDRMQLETKRLRIENPRSQYYEDPDMNFFKSIIPDIQMMSAQQKRKFKIGVLELIDEVYRKYPDRRAPSVSDSNGYWRKS